MNSPAQLTEDAGATDVLVALSVGLAQIFLHAFVVAVAVCSDVALQHGDGGNGKVTDAVLLTERSCGQ